MDITNPVKQIVSQVAFEEDLSRPRDTKLAQYLVSHEPKG